MSKDFGTTQGHTDTERWPAAGSVNAYSFTPSSPRFVRAICELPNDPSTGNQVASMEFTATADGVPITAITNPDVFKDTPASSKTVNMNGGAIPTVQFPLVPGAKHYVVTVKSSAPMSCQFNLALSTRPS